MTTLLTLTYVSLCILVFKVLRIRASKWSIGTAVLSGAFLVGSLLVLMNYNHPFTSDARVYFFATPISPAVQGKVVEVPVKPNVPLRANDVLFRLDPKPFEYIVAQRRAELADAEQKAKELKAALRSAAALVDQARATRDRARDEYARNRAAIDDARHAGRPAPISEAQVEARHQTYLASEAALASAVAQAERARLAAEAEIDGVNTSVARLRAELGHAEYQLGETVVRAPADGYVSQLFLRPGMMAVPLPIKPVMVFIHDERMFAAAFEQNALQRVDVGDRAEIAFAAVPGRVFRGRVRTVLDTIAQGQLEPSGALAAPEIGRTPGRAITLIEITDDLTGYRIPGGATAEVAIYTKHLSRLAIVRMLLLRMKAWGNYISRGT